MLRACRRTAVVVVRAIDNYCFFACSLFSAYLSRLNTLLL